MNELGKLKMRRQFYFFRTQREQQNSDTELLNVQYRVLTTGAAVRT